MTNPPGVMRWIPRGHAERSIPFLVLFLLVVAPLWFGPGSEAAPGDPKPDLVVVSANITGWSRTTGHSLTATLENTGDAPAPSSVLSISASDGSWNTAIDVPPIGVDARINVSTMAHTTFYGTRTLSFLADGGATVTEHDENNNTFDLTRAFGRPDLRVVIHESNDPELRLGESTSFIITIENVGNAVATPVEVRVTEEGTPVTMPFLWDPLHPGQTDRPSFFWTATKIGTTTFNVTLDPEGRLPESNETNNGHTFTVPVLEPSPMHDINVDTHTVNDGGTASFNVNVMARGDHPPASMRVRYIRDGIEHETREVSSPFNFRQSHDLYQVQQGVEWTHPNPQLDSQYNVQVTLDPDTAWASHVWYNGTGDGGATCCWQDEENPEPEPPPTPGPTPDYHEDRFGKDDPAHIVRIDLPAVLETIPEPLPVAVLVRNVESPGPVELHLRVTGPDGAVILDHEFRPTTFTGAYETKTAKTRWIPETSGLHTFEATLIDHSRPVSPSGYTDRETVDVEVRLKPPGTPEPTPPTTEPASDLSTQSTETATGPSTRTIGIAAAGGLLTTTLAGAWVWASEPRRYRLLARLLGLPGLLLFSRIKKDKVLDHATRERIHETVQSNPGIHFSGLRRLLDMPNGTLVHHLRTLEREGLCKTERVGGRLHFYATGEPARMAVGLTPRQDLILRSLVKRPGIAQADLARHLGVSRQALHQHLTPLRDLGLVADLPHGRTRRLYLDNSAPERLATCGSCHATLVTDGGPALCVSCGDRLPPADDLLSVPLSSAPYAASRTH